MIWFNLCFIKRPQTTMEEQLPWNWPMLEGSSWCYSWDQCLPSWSTSFSSCSTWRNRQTTTTCHSATNSWRRFGSWASSVRWPKSCGIASHQTHPDSLPWNIRVQRWTRWNKRRKGSRRDRKGFEELIYSRLLNNLDRCIGGTHVWRRISTTEGTARESCIYF